MNVYQNKEVKKYKRLAMVLSLISLVVMCAATFLECRYYRKEENAAIASLVGAFTEYDAVVDGQLVSEGAMLDTDKLIRILNDDLTQEEGESVLEAYGLKQDVYYIAKMQKMERWMIAFNTVLLFVIEVILFLIFSYYLKKRQKKLDELAGYIGVLAQGNYALELMDNSEDELSNLKNELYKISVMQKEQARISTERREALADSVSDISHQLKTPLTSISILLDNLTDSYDMKPEIREKFLLEMRKQITSLNWMVIAMLKLSRLDAGVAEFEEHEIVLKELLDEVCTNLEIISEVMEVDIMIACEETLIIRGDYNWNREAVQNIVKNAIEHSCKGEKVRIEGKDNDVYTQISIRNHGKMILPEDRRHIFERFYRAGGADENSIGIGLALAKSIVEKQNGYISVESDEEETVFTIKYMKYVV